MRRDYRLLKPGEQVQDGDEFLVDYGGEIGPVWVLLPRENRFGYTNDRIRRPATGPASAGQMIEVLEAEIAFLRELLSQKESA